MDGQGEVEVKVFAELLHRRELLTFRLYGPDILEILPRGLEGFLEERLGLRGLPKGPEEENQMPVCLEVPQPVSYEKLGCKARRYQGSRGQ